MAFSLAQPFTAGNRDAALISARFTGLALWLKLSVACGSICPEKGGEPPWLIYLICVPSRERLG